MNKFFNTCRRCINPWVLGVIMIVIIALIIFVPILGVAGLVVAAPLIGCTVMCGAMAFMMKGKKKDE